MLLAQLPNVRRCLFEIMLDDFGLLFGSRITQLSIGFLILQKHSPGQLANGLGNGFWIGRTVPVVHLLHMVADSRIKSRFRFSAEEPLDFQFIRPVPKRMVFLRPIDPGACIPWNVSMSVLLFAAARIDCRVFIRTRWCDR